MAYRVYSVLSLLALLLITSLLIVSTARAQTVDVIESVDVTVSADVAWEAVKGFNQLDSWHPAVTKTEITTGDPTQRGAIRVLTIGDNAGTVQETLTAYRPDDYQLSYVINSTDIIPVKDYESTLKVLPVSDTLSLIIWSGNFLPNPPQGEPDSAAVDTITGIYRDGLNNLKQMLQAQTQ